MVALQILVLSVWVRVLVWQQKVGLRKSQFDFFCRSDIIGIQEKIKQAKYMFNNNF